MSGFAFWVCLTFGLGWWTWVICSFCFTRDFFGGYTVYGLMGGYALM